MPQMCVYERIGLIAFITVLAIVYTPTLVILGRRAAQRKRLVITDYFLNEDDFGKVHAEGDHKIHVALVTPDNLVLDTRFNLDFNTAFAAPARPHGVAFK